MNQVVVVKRPDFPVETKTICFGGGIAFGGCSLGNTDNHPVHVRNAGIAAVGGDHHSLSVVVGDRQEGGAFAAVTTGRPGGITGQNVNLTRLQGGKPIGSLQIDMVDGFGIAKNRCGDDPTEVGVKTDVLAFFGQNGETRQSIASTALQFASRDNLVE